MCFHTLQRKEASQLERRYKARIAELEILQQGPVNGFTFPRTPVIVNEDPSLIQFYHWGLIPSWARDNEIRAMTLNAKIETINEKPSFKACVKNRCLVIVDGFFEWQWLDPKGKKKQKYQITIPGDELFSLAGIWSEWVDKGTGEVIRSYSIVTTEANELMAEIHNNKKRMPVVLHQAEEADWLKGQNVEDFKIRNVELVAETV